MLRLVARCDDQVRLFALTRGAASIGASVDNDFVLPFPGVSRRHARLECVDEGVVFIDAGSKNGILYEGQRLAHVLLRPGREIRIGRARLTLEQVSSSDAEMGLVLAEALTAAGLLTATSTVLLTAQGGSAAAALHFVRETDAEPFAPGDDARLDTARDVLGAETLLIFQPAAGDVALADCRGPLPPTSVLPALAHAGLGPGSSRLHDHDSGRIVLLAEKVGPLRLAAVFAPEAAAVAVWQEDFLAYLATRLAPERAPDEPLRPEPRLELPPELVLGEAPASRALLREIESAAASRLDVLLLGEAGTGKELVARALHLSGPLYRRGPFVVVHCAAIPAELTEAELFGVQKRVDHGVDPRPGLFSQARGGTLFLDEVGELPPPIQAKLLRVLEEREIHPVGAPAPRKIDLRVIAASNRRLAALATSGGFHPVLYHRLRRLEIHLPALRERRQDLPRLIAVFTSRAAANQGKRILGVSRAALDRLLEHNWPGNVRELKSAIDGAVLHCLDGGVLESNLLSLDRSPPPSASFLDETMIVAPEPPPSVLPAAAPTLKEQVAALEKEAIQTALAACGGNRTQAAQQLGLTRSGLNLKMKRLGLGGVKP